MTFTANSRLGRHTAALFLVVTIVGCTTRYMRQNMTTADETVSLCSQASDTIEIEYLGSGGLLFRRGEHAVATGPYLTNAEFAAVAGGLPLSVEPARVDPLIPKLRGISAMLIGHSHYDHLMDAAYLFDQLDAPNAKLYGNQTARHLTASLFTDHPDAVVAVNALAGNRQHVGSWLPSVTSPIRFMAIESEHAPHLAGITFLQGHQDTDLEELPKTASEWVEGRKTYAFIIDFLDDGVPVFRIHYQDTASNTPIGLPPDAMLEEKPVDLAVVCVSSFQQVEVYPGELVRRLQPKHVVMAHWESFFRDPLKEPRVLKGTNLREFVRRLDRTLPSEGLWTLPKPGVTLSFRFCPDAPS